MTEISIRTYVQIAFILVDSNLPKLLLFMNIVLGLKINRIFINKQLNYRRVPDQ